MSRPVVVLRPEPGNSATVERLGAAGLTAIALPLFEVRPVDWALPAVENYGALLLTSANTLRFGGAQLTALRALPVLAVGEATAEAARRAGFVVEAVGAGGVAALLDAAEAGQFRRLLYLGGRDRMIEPGGAVATAITVYASEALAVEADDMRRLESVVVMLHSARAASRLDALAGIDRSTVRLAAISGAVAGAAGEGWGQRAIAATPTDAALVALAARLAD